MSGVDCCPYRKKKFLVQRSYLGGSEDYKLLVGGTIHQHGYALGGKCFLDAHSLPDGVACDGHIQVVAEQLEELDAQQSALGKHAALLLDVIAEMLVAINGIGEYHSLAEQGSHLGAANVEHVAQACNLLQCDVAAFGSESLAQARPVDE